MLGIRIGYVKINWNEVQRCDWSEWSSLNHWYDWNESAKLNKAIDI